MGLPLLPAQIDAGTLVFRLLRLTLPPFRGFGYLMELDHVVRPDLLKSGLHLRETHSKEFTPAVDPINPLLIELPMKCRFQRHGVVAEDQRVYVELEGHRRTSQLEYPLHWVF